MGYTPVFDHIYAGTLFGRWPAAPVWASLLPLCDKNGVIAYSWTALAGMTGWPLDLLKQGITELMQPDPGSNSSLESGKRLVPHDQRDGKDWGWRAVNHGKYREKARKANFDAARVADGRNADRMQTRRDPRRPAETREHPPSNTNTDKEKKDSPTAISNSNMGSTDAAGAAPRAAPAEPISSNWQPNTANREWMVKAGLAPKEQATVVNEFVRWARNAELRKSEKNWQHAFSRNPTVKAAVGRGKSAGVDAGAQDREQLRRLAEVVGVKRQPEESDDDYAKRVHAANGRRLASIGRAATV